MTQASTTRVSLNLDSVRIEMDLPHDSVDTETIKQAAMEAINNHVNQVVVIPRWNGTDREDGPEFTCYVDVFEEDVVIEDDDRKDTPAWFEQDLDWWTEVEQARKDGA